jgi:hypothetical protein
MKTYLELLKNLNFSEHPDIFPLIILTIVGIVVPLTAVILYGFWVFVIKKEKK